MGIQGLLPVLRDITHRTHVSAFSGKRAAIDGYSWLYKGAYSCPLELCEDKPTDAYVKFCMSRIRLLLHHGVIPFVVFDGDKLPAKALTEDQRQSSRRSNKERGRQLSEAGHTRAALDVYQKALEATPQMARTLIEALKEAGVQFCVAPYEADAQLAHLALTGRADVIITEDSDLLAYGCPEVLFKLDKSGECDHVRLADLPLNRSPSFAGLDHDNFIEVCVLAGCDFVASMPGMGVKKAHAGVRRFRSFLNVVKAARLNNGKVPRDYEVEVQKAYWTFRHQRVWDTEARKLVHLHAIPGGSLAQSRLFVPRAVPVDAALDFLGPVKPDSVCADIAAGLIDPMTHRRFVVRKVHGMTHVTLDGDAQAKVLPGLQRASAPVGPPVQPPQPSVPAATQQQRSSVPAMFQPRTHQQGARPQQRASAAPGARVSAPATFGRLQSSEPGRCRSKEAPSQQRGRLLHTQAAAPLQQQQQQQQTSSGADTDCSARAQCNGQSVSRPAHGLPCIPTLNGTADQAPEARAGHQPVNKPVPAGLCGLHRRTNALPSVPVHSAATAGSIGNARPNGMLGALRAQLASAAGDSAPATSQAHSGLGCEAPALCADNAQHTAPHSDDAPATGAAPDLGTQCSVSEGVSLLLRTDVAATQSTDGADPGLALSSQPVGRSALHMLAHSRSLSMSIEAGSLAMSSLSQSSAGQGTDAGYDTAPLPPGDTGLRQAFKPPRRRPQQPDAAAPSALASTPSSLCADAVRRPEAPCEASAGSLTASELENSLSAGPPHTEGCGQQLQARPLRDVLNEHAPGRGLGPGCSSPPVPLREVLGNSSAPVHAPRRSLKDKLLGTGKRKPDVQGGALMDASNRSRKSLESCKLTAVPAMAKFKKPRRLHEV